MTTRADLSQIDAAISKVFNLPATINVEQFPVGPDYHYKSRADVLRETLAKITQELENASDDLGTLTANYVKTNYVIYRLSTHLFKESVLADYSDEGTLWSKRMFLDNAKVLDFVDKAQRWLSNSLKLQVRIKQLEAENAHRLPTEFDNE